jgi:pyruvate dehydrogenase E1 component beta subunit
VVREGVDVTIVAWSTMVPLAEQAAEHLAADGVSVEVIDPRTLVPFDLEAIVESVDKTGRLIIVHEAVRRSGFGAEIAASISDSRAFDSLLAPIVRVANPGVPVPHSAALHKYALPRLDDVIAAVRRLKEYG